MFRFEKERLAARRRLLNGFDITNFDSVPDFIINAFFGNSSYKSQLLVCTFGFLNGIEVELLISLLRWTQFTEAKKVKIRSLYRCFENSSYQGRYYSYNVHHNAVMYLNGVFRNKK